MSRRRGPALPANAWRRDREERNARLRERDAEYMRVFGSACGEPRERSEALQRIYEERAVARLAFRGK